MNHRDRFGYHEPKADNEGRKRTACGLPWRGGMTWAADREHTSCVACLNRCDWCGDKIVQGYFMAKRVWCSWGSDNNPGHHGTKITVCNGCYAFAGKCPKGHSYFPDLCFAPGCAGGEAVGAFAAVVMGEPT